MQTRNLMAPPIQRTQKGLDYEAWITKARDILQGMDAKSMEVAKRANIDFIRGLSDPRHRPGHLTELEKAITPAAVHVDSMLATLSVMYANDEYIGERLMPAVPVSKRSDVYSVYNKRDRFGFPDDEIGHRASANELDESRSTANYSVRDYGFKNFLDLETVQNQDAPLNEMIDVVEAINEGIAFRRELRILAILTASGNYAGNTAGAGTDWDDTTGGSVVADILAATSALWSGPNPTRTLGFCGINVWNQGLANNPAIRDLFKQVREGLATTEAIARYFGLDDILISRARQDTANSGQTASFSRMLASDVFGVLKVARRPSTRSLHFGSTFRMQGDPATTQWTDPDVGKRGGLWARVAVSEDHKVVAGDAGYLITSILT